MAEKTIVFPATELTPWAEPVAPDSMQEGRVYFAVQYVDSDMLLPVLYPLRFMGYEGQNPRDRTFKRYDDDAESLEVYGPDEGKHIFEYDRALENLMRCALRRRSVEKQSG